MTMESPHRSWPADRLLAAYGKSGADPREAEEALWEYWRRVAVGEVQFSQEAYGRLLALRVWGRANAICVLVEHDRLPARWFEPTLVAVTDFERGDAHRVRAFVAARRAVHLLRQGATDGRLAALRAVHGKGTSWAAIEAVEFLSREEQRALIEAIDGERLFTAAQRADVRERIQRTRRD